MQGQQVFHIQRVDPHKLDGEWQMVTTADEHDIGDDPDALAS